MKLIERTDYLSRLIDLAGTPDIKIITGMSSARAVFIENAK